MIVRDISIFRKSMRESGFSKSDEAAVWDFYVTKSLSRASNQHRFLTDYFKPSFCNPINLLDRMMKASNIIEDHCVIAPGKSITNALSKLGLADELAAGINITVPRIACLISSESDSTNLQYSVKRSVINIMLHVRNAFAHGNTYFFENDFLMLEDLSFDQSITARMIFHKSTLISWIRLFDENSCYYPELHINNSRIR